MSNLQVTFISESIAEPTEWYFRGPHHIVAVYQGGHIRTKELEFDRGLSRHYLPKAGDVLVVPAGRRVAITAQGEQAAFCQLEVPTALLDQRELQARVAHPDALMLQLAARMRSISDRDDVIARLLRESLVDVMWLHLSDHYAAIRRHAVSGRALEPAAQARLMEYVEDSLDAEISLAALARHSEMSISEFRKAFVDAFRQTPYQFVLNRRMDRARKLLTGTSLPVTDISVAVGFSSPSHFATTFKARVGVTPTVYRSGL
ncbi:helix-turn-helix transcriptional regulator [Mycobacteroides franklinii]|uniref:Exoenzyme S synthesis regulatory protein ExsA n=1 Tax=Mycobacteroides franklinii TaxID=948102 RepID=A0A4R8RAX0_9MYCO|nr:AraC family transcriptional regulator [Mycobacteroides franklinii]TDZ41940.1 Exoenzyme S synthesis regulatory protein ExsA [Mycobacteroides franklinii]TDZ52088.1 Exoenzyme S synthesis regulatory protein ExsA [Mycobacteroides franklinii]TDZ55495.1 Exoenzyme S synthesis regulatory protein ExsA [Mycobacteroides franklinii]TDZ62436.1 Exoenzyme S synthesis regulatory protein ExsA [Mycobacteroides franklinii]TDZ68833.1 Exoenzyme S synthesis regulatory protein ExsA [Mycobacteroides franklinii]